jgi:hypothetical protein
VLEEREEYGERKKRHITCTLSYRGGRVGKSSCGGAVFYGITRVLTIYGRRRQPLNGKLCKLI